MIAAFFAQRMPAHGGKNTIGIFRRNEGQQLAFVGDVERIEAEDFAGAFDFFADGNGRFIEADADAARIRRFR